MCLMTTQEIHNIYSVLSARYDRISVSTIKGLLKGKIKVKGGKEALQYGKEESPKLNEVETAFLTHTCAILTAFRGSFTLEGNLERNAKLKQDMDAVGLHYKPVRGCYREADQEYVNIEYCFFIYSSVGAEDFFTKVYTLSEKYEQDSFLFKRAGINRSAFLVATNNNGRAEFGSDIKFAGQLFLHVPDSEAWTDCSDGRFAFQLKGMILTGTANKKVSLGEGNIFDVQGYNATGLAVIRRADEQYIKEECKKIEGQIHVSQHIFREDVSSPEYLHKVVFECLKELRDNKCKRIGFHCSAVLGGSAYDAAAVVYDSIQSWSKRYDKKFEWIVIDDPHGQYAKLVKDKEL